MLTLREKIEKETKEEMRARQAIAAKDPQRPMYHYQPYPSWMNDPIPFFWKGEYHVFHQHSPEGKPYHYMMNWEHIVSRDLVHWSTLSSPLTPSPGGPDMTTWDKYISEKMYERDPSRSLYEYLHRKENLCLNKRGDNDPEPTPPRPDTYGVWSGCVIEHDGIFYIFYTGAASGGQCVATSKDLISWEKAEDNRVIKEWRQVGDRDPCVWKEKDKWYMMLCTLDMYESKDLAHWRYVRKLEGECDELPDFFPLGDKHVLLTHCYRKADDPRGAATSYGEDIVGTTAWDVGGYANLRFTSESHGLVGWGNLYGSKTMLDDRGRRIMACWITEGRPIDEQIKAGWSGVLALPRLLTILPDNTLGMEPVPELEILRGKHWEYKNLQLDGSEDEVLRVLNGAQGDCIEILARFTANDAKEFGIVVQGTDRIAYDREKGQLAGAMMEIAPGEDLTLRIYVDRSVTEVFANGRFCKTIRSYHKPDDSKAVMLFARSGNVEVNSLDMWEMRSI